MQRLFMHNYEIRPARVTIDFGGRCIDGPEPLPGDACATVPVRWDSTDLQTNVRSTSQGTDYLTATFVPAENRWWLCSSRLGENATLGHRFYVR